jgi:hypothetical protein
MCELQTKHFSTYVEELILPVWVCDTCPKLFTYDKIAWTSNMNPFELNFHIFVELSTITKKGENERSLFGFGNCVTT